MKVLYVGLHGQRGGPPGRSGRGANFVQKPYEKLTLLHFASTPQTPSGLTETWTIDY